MKKKLKYVILLTLIMTANVALMPLSDYVPPSEFFYNNLFSTKLWLYRQRPQMDYLILGNSRTEAGIHAHELEHLLASSAAKGPSIHDLAVGGAYMPMFHDVVTKVIADKLPKTVIMGIGPGDFDRENPSVGQAKAALKKTYGWQALGLPYFSPLTWLEKKMTDIVAIFFPGFYFRSEAEKIFFGRPLKKLRREGAWYSPLFKVTNYYFVNFYYEKFWEGLPTFNSDGLSSSVMAEKISEYFWRFRFLISWRPTRNDLRENGESKTRDFFRPHFHYPSYLNEFKKSGDYEKYRNSSFCDTRAALARSENSDQVKLLKFFNDKKIPVYLVLLPSIVLGTCENNDTYNKELKKFLTSLEKRFSNLVVLDYLNNFDHPYQDFSLYRDMDHLNPNGARLITARLAEDIQRRESSPSLTRN